MKKYSFKTILSLFWTFFKIGLFTFGGGYAMISLIERETVDNHRWVSREDIMNMIIIAESTPGVIAINSATFIGYKVGGFWGSFFATLGVVMPSFIVISSLYFVIDKFMTNIWVAAAFRSIRACVTVLIFNAVVKMFKLVDRNWFNYVVMVIAFGVATFTNFNVIYMILIGAALGIFYQLLKAKTDKKQLPLRVFEQNQEGSSDENLPNDEKPINEEIFDDKDVNRANSVEKTDEAVSQEARGDKK